MRNNNLRILYPIKMVPYFKDYIWGGDRLIREWGKPCPDAVAAESWELSAHKNGQSVAANGPFKGETLGEIVEKYGNRCLGAHSEKSDRFPILIKFLDTKQKLSIQVHPDDRYALIHENDHGKTEMYYIVDANEGSGILCGLKTNLTKEQFEERIRNRTVEEELNWIPVKKGDVFLVHPGTVHAIGDGVIIAEIQQNSNITYRIYDYDRTTPDGTPRTLHIENALDVLRLEKDAFDGKPEGPAFSIPGATGKTLAQCRYFTVCEYTIRERCDFFVGNLSFQSLVFVKGNGIIRWKGEEITVRCGDTFFLPAGLGPYSVCGDATVLVTEV